MNKKNTRVKGKKNNSDIRDNQLKRNLTVMGIVIGLAVIVFIVLPSTLETESITTTALNVTGDWMDVHGIGIVPFAADNKSLYLATHHGLYKRTVNNNSSNWMQIGKDKSDLMGFSINQDKQNIMYSSGHPQTSGNSGFRVSSDYGVTWKTISNVTNPKPIDFHTMAVGSNPNVIYGASGMGNKIYLSSDNGVTWSTINPPNGVTVVTLAVNQTNSNSVYVSTTKGIFSSQDQGKNWQKINNELFDPSNTMVTGIEISTNGKVIYAFVAPPSDPNANEGKGYIVKSIDSGKTWAKTEGQIPGVVFISKFAFDNTGKIYAVLIQDSSQTGVAASVYSSNDNGKKWILEGTNSKLVAKANML